MSSTKRQSFKVPGVSILHRRRRHRSLQNHHSQSLKPDAQSIHITRLKTHSSNRIGSVHKNKAPPVTTSDHQVQVPKGSSKQSTIVNESLKINEVCRQSQLRLELNNVSTVIITSHQTSPSGSDPTLFNDRRDQDQINRKKEPKARKKSRVCFGSCTRLCAILTPLAALLFAIVIATIFIAVFVEKKSLTASITSIVSTTTSTAVFTWFTSFTTSPTTSTNIFTPSTNSTTLSTTSTDMFTSSTISSTTSTDMFTSSTSSTTSSTTSTTISTSPTSSVTSSTMSTTVLTSSTSSTTPSTTSTSSTTPSATSTSSTTPSTTSTSSTTPSATSTSSTTPSTTSTSSTTPSATSTSSTTPSATSTSSTTPSTTSTSSTTPSTTSTSSTTSLTTSTDMLTSSTTSSTTSTDMFTSSTSSTTVSTTSTTISTSPTSSITSSTMSTTILTSSTSSTTSLTTSTTILTSSTSSVTSSTMSTTILTTSTTISTSPTSSVTSSTMSTTILTTSTTISTSPTSSVTSSTMSTTVLTSSTSPTTLSTTSIDLFTSSTTSSTTSTTISTSSTSSATSSTTSTDMFTSSTSSTTLSITSTTISTSSTSSATSSTTSTSTTTLMICYFSCLNQTWISPLGLLAKWTFDSTLADEIDTYNATAMNNPSFIANGYVNQGLVLNAASNQYLYTSYIPLINASYTIELWFYPTAYPNPTDHSFLGLCTNLSNDQCLHLTIRKFAATYRLYMSFFGDNCTGNTSVPLNQWTHAAFVFDLTSFYASIYQNGLFVGGVTFSQPLQGTTNNVTIGYIPGIVAAYGSNFFQGYIDQLTIVNRTKPACEILDDATLATYYNFDINPIVTDAGPNSLLSSSQYVTFVSSGVISNAISFSNSSSYFQIGDLTGLGTVNKPFSISLWIRPYSLAGTVVFVQNGTAGNHWCIPFIGFATNGSLVAQIWTGSVTQSVFGPALSISSVWSYIVQTWSTTNGLRLYLNNILVAAYASAVPYSASGLPDSVVLAYRPNLACSLGSIGSQTAFHGDIDDFRIYSRELTGDDVCALYHY